MTIEHFKDTLLKKLPKFNVLVVLMLNLLFVKLYAILRVALKHGCMLLLK